MNTLRSSELTQFKQDSIAVVQNWLKQDRIAVVRILTVTLSAASRTASAFAFSSA